MEFTLPEDLNTFKYKALKWAASFETACFFDSNGYSDPYSALEVLIGAGSKEEIVANSGTAFSSLASFIKDTNDLCMGFLGYDLKNEVEALSSNNPDLLNFPDLFFFKPKHIINIQAKKLEIISDSPQAVFAAVMQVEISDKSISQSLVIKSRIAKEDYIARVNSVQQHISRGDIYEMNLCQEFYAENAIIDPISAFRKLNKLSPTPFASFFKYQSKYILSASPERFLSRKAEKLISQPIKGTVRRSPDPVEDDHLKKNLRDNLKEQSENVMIVDLVRNDLTKCAVPGSVKVEELFGIYSFEQVHQMISTVVCQVDPGTENADIIKALFPMGSMTGAPKISAMQLIEKYEITKRGIFSGAIGYFKPNGDFDFNVVIRTMLYDEDKRYLSFQAGSAITFASDAEKEYEECILKTSAIRASLLI